MPLLPVRFAHLLAASLIVAGASDALAGSPAVVWPASAGVCSTTLQACIDGVVDDSIIEIGTDIPIDEAITLTNRSLSLVAAAGAHPRFAAGRSLTANTIGAVNGSVRLRGLAFSDGRVSYTCSGGATASLEMRDLQLTRSAGGTPAHLAVQSISGCVLDATLEGNRIDGVPAGINSGLIDLKSTGGTFNAYVAHNRIARNSAANSDGAGIFADVISLGGTGSGVLRMFANEIRGTYNRGGIFLSEGLASTTPSHYTAAVVNNAVICTGTPGSGNGIAFVANSGTITATTANNTTTGCARGVFASRWSGGSATARVNGHVWNNLVVASSEGLNFTADLTPNLQNDYNLINAPTLANTSLGAHTLSVPAGLVAAVAPRLRPGSPAINAADALFLANVLIEYGLPLTDADGLRRTKGGGTDIGAYESGDVSALHVASAANAVNAYITRIDLAATNGQIGASVHATRNYGVDGPESSAAFGVYYEPSVWTLYHEDFSPLATGLKWNVFVPGSGSGVFTHFGTAANTSDWRTQIDSAATNGQPGRILIATHNWTATPTYLTHPIGVHYTGTGSAGRWHVGTINGAALPETSAFNIYSQSPSPNAFRLEAQAGANRVTIDHPLINDVSCAAIHVTRIIPSGATGPVAAHDLEFSPAIGRWRIFSPASYQAGTAFNVVIDPAQVFACTDRIFADDFD